MDIAKARVEIKLAKGRIKTSVEELNKAYFGLDMALSHLEPTPIPPDQDVVFRNSVLIGNPNMDRWGGNSVINCFARGPRDLQAYNGRIYGGGGDHTGGGGTPGNMGPVPVFSFGIDGVFDDEITLREEIVDQLMVYGDTLWIPGTDAQGSAQGSGYVHKKINPSWHTLPPVSGAAHVWSLAVMRGHPYILTSYPSGLSLLLSYHPAGSPYWLAVDRAEGDYGTVGNVSFESIIDLEDSILIFGQSKETGDEKGKACIYQYKNGQRQKAVNNPFPAAPAGYSSRGTRLVHYQSGILYADSISSSASWLSPSNQTLYCLYSDLNVGVAWEASGDEFLRDIVVRDDTVFIMTVIAGYGRVDKLDEFQARIWRSTDDLSEWNIAADCVFPALPYSFEILGDTFFVALGSRGKGKGTPSDPGYADVESGNIYRLVE